MKNSQIEHQRKLKQILQRKDIWRGNAHAKLRTSTAKKSLTTGYEKLDSALVHQGWPLGGLIEITQKELGMGEWQLIRPALQSLVNTAGYTLCINPPEKPYAPGLHANNLCLNDLIIVEPKNRTHAVSACIEALGNPACKALLFWESHDKLKPQELRRLQLSATNKNTFCLLFRNEQAVRHSSPAVLRLSIKIAKTGIYIDIIKQRGTFHRKTLHIPLPNTWQVLPDLSKDEWLNPLNDTLQTARILPFCQPI